MMSKRTRGERCCGCGRQLVVLATAVTVKCGSCGVITRVRPFPNHGGQPFRPMPPPGGGRYRPRPSPSSPAAPPFPAGRPGNYPAPGPALRPVRGLASASATASRPTAAPAPASPAPRPAWGLAPPQVHGKKRAVLCGVSYRHKNYRVHGTVNDVKSMKHLLLQTLGFPNDCILVLTEDEKDPRMLPTKQNILKAMRWLVKNSRKGDSLLFYFTGHGSRRHDQSGDEKDGYDETLCPLDYDDEGSILDDEINATMVTPLRPGATLHAVVDSCYSGTVLDLPFLCKMDRDGNFKWKDERIPYTVYTGTGGGLALCLSACDDHQSSGATTAFTGKPRGVMTYSFIKAVENEPGLTYGRLLYSIRILINQARTTPSSTAADSLNNQPRPPQEPQLSSSHKFDIHKMKFFLGLYHCIIMYVFYCNISCIGQRLSHTVIGD